MRYIIVPYSLAGGILVLHSSEKRYISFFKYKSFTYSFSITHYKVSELHRQKDASATEFKGICDCSTSLLYHQYFWED